MRALLSRTACQFILFVFCASSSVLIEQTSQAHARFCINAHTQRSCHDDHFLIQFLTADGYFAYDSRGTPSSRRRASCASMRCKSCIHSNSCITLIALQFTIHFHSTSASLYAHDFAFSAAQSPNHAYFLVTANSCRFGLICVCVIAQSCNISRPCIRWLESNHNR